MHTNGGYYRLMIFHTVFIAAIVSTACSQVLDLSNGTFHRDGTAYYSNDGLTMQSYSPDVPRTDTVLACSASDGKMIYGEGPSGENIAPWCSNSRGLYGISVSNNYKLYRSSDGVSWTNIYTSPYVIASVFSAANDMLIAWFRTATAHGTDPEYFTAYYSMNYGVTWNACINADGGTVVFPGRYPYPWNFNQRPAKEGESYGTIIASTYSSIYTTPNQIWRSTDNGITWGKVLELEPYYILHFHAVGYHAALGKWVVDTGDNQNPNPPYNTRQHTFVSDDDGQTWHEYAYNDDGSGKRSNSGQVTRFRDYGHPTRILIASDEYQRIGWLDLVTWEVGTFMKAPPRSYSGSNYFFDVFKYDNLWYASLFSSGTAGTHNSAIYVSPDLEQWAIYHRFSDASVLGGNQFAGFLGGKLHIKTSTDSLGAAGHFSISPAKVAIVDNALVLTPQKLNLMTESQSKCNSTSGWFYWSAEWWSPTIFKTVDDPNFAGNKSIYLEKTLSGTVNLYSPAVAVTPGQTYIPHFWVQGTMRLVVIGFTDTRYNILGTDTNWGIRGDNKWTEVWGAPYTVPSNITSVRLKAVYYADRMDGVVEAWLGAAEIAASPYSPWHVGQATSSKEYLDHTVNLSANFTHIFSAECMPNAVEAGNNPLYLCTYYISPTDYVELYYGPSQDKFYLESTGCDPGDNGIISSGSQWLHRHTTVRVAVRYSNGTMRLSLTDGDGVEHVGNVLVRHKKLLHGQGRIIRTGSHDGTAVIPHILYDSHLLNGVLSDEQIKTIFSAPLVNEPNIVIDSDGDQVPDANDNCPYTYNSNQADLDHDGVGDVCDNCPSTYDPNQVDSDYDGVGDVCDNCPSTYNLNQADFDHDGVGDVCDDCPSTYDPNQVDSDYDGVGDVCDNCPLTYNPDQADLDQDGVGDVCDDCPSTYDPNQADSDHDGVADACDDCPTTYDPNQTDSDHDGVGDVCDNCLSVYNPNQADLDQDGIGDACDNCPSVYNPDQADSDQDGIGDACECSSRFNLDGIGAVDIDDLVIFASNWLAIDSGLLGDFNNDNQVDLSDLAILSQHWLALCNESD